uniref:Uncharacterized protein n=1 Tax=Trichobilharzia regenti TaxID=157069 RepID=A0AA85IYD9_TRIRE|nr:unnamed protein product [Trichobilharzia regenti]
MYNIKVYLHIHCNHKFENETAGMLAMVNEIKGLCDWITKNKWISILLTLLAALPMFILALLKILKIGRHVDHFLIGFGVSFHESLLPQVT